MIGDPLSAEKKCWTFANAFLLRLEDFGPANPLIFVTRSRIQRSLFLPQRKNEEKTSRRKNCPKIGVCGLWRPVWRRGER